MKTAQYTVYSPLDGTFETETKSFATEEYQRRIDGYKRAATETGFVKFIANGRLVKQWEAKYQQEFTAEQVKARVNADV